MLSLVMVVGVFAGMKLDTKAAGMRTIRFEDLRNGDIVHTGDIIPSLTLYEANNSHNPSIYQGYGCFHFCIDMYYF